MNFFIFLNKIKILVKFSVVIFFSFFIIPVLLIIYLISPFFLVRFKNLRSERIGHFAANTELYLCEKKKKINTPKQNYIDLFFCNDICNQQLLSMWKRKILIFPKWILYNFFIVNKFLSKFFKFTNKHEIPDSSSDRDIYDLLETSEPNLQFTAKEEKLGVNLLKKLNLQIDSKFVILAVRDNTYLESKFPNQNWSYHDVRNQNLDNFILAIDEIVKRGYYVIRVGGTSQSKKLKYSNPKVIDYTHSKFRNDFLDIYLGAKCEFCISSGFGLDAVPRIFRKPIISILLAPIDIHTELSSQITILRPYFDIREKKKLTLDQMLNIKIATIMNGHEFTAAGLKVLENTPEEIRDVTIEMMDRLDGKWEQKNSDEIIQKNFWNKFDKMHNLYIQNFGKKAHGTLKGRIGTSFLRNNCK